MKEVTKPTVYDPEVFLKKNLNGVIPAKTVFNKIEFSGFVKRAFHSNDRPNGIITISYSENRVEKKIQLFLKQHSDAGKVYQHMRSVYQGLKLYNQEKHMPKPILCDEKNGANYMEFKSGKALSYTTLTELLFNRKKNLSQLFYRIGNWLACYHEVTRLEKSILVNDLKDKVFDELERTSLFTNDEKKVLEKKIKNLNFSDTYLMMVKPHNDFALRNIIYSSRNDFMVIDWDALFHKKFTSEASVWNDITSFIITVNSLKRFAPAIRVKNINALTDSFIEGYFGKFNRLKKDDINNYLYLFTLSFYLGIIGDRSLPEIYNSKFGNRFIKKLHQNLLKGFI